MDIIQSPSLNFNDRKQKLDVLILHYTGMEDGPSALERMQDEAAEVSAHYMVDVDGTVFQLVAEDKRAWHAGRGSWQGDEDLNSRSIGIEIVNGGHNIPLPDGSLPPYTRVQIDAVIALCKGIVARNHIPQTRIVGHSDIAPTRKEDPGEHFPWEEFASQGIGLWPEQIGFAPPPEDRIVFGDKGPKVAELQHMLKVIGYGIDVNADYDALTRDVVIAFQRRWHQAYVTGEADIVTVKLVERVAELSSNTSV